MFVGKYLSAQTHLPVVSVIFPLPAQRKPCLIPGETIQYHDSVLIACSPPFSMFLGSLAYQSVDSHASGRLLSIFSALTKVGNDKAVSS